MIGAAHRDTRRRVARLGIIVILFQAIVFGWHHHPLALSPRGGQPVLHAGGNSPLTPAAADDDCEICQALHHLSAAPGEFSALPSPAVVTDAVRSHAAVLAARTEARAFRARAPPRA